MSELEAAKRPSLALVREKSLVIEKSTTGQDGRIIETIRSNRCSFMLGSDEVVVRSRYIHHALRFGALLYKNYLKAGPVGVRRLDWVAMWGESHTEFDTTHDEIGWIQVYVNGDNVYATHRSPHSDIIEKCAVSGRVENYDESLGVTERLFAESGRHIEIKSTAVLTATVKESKDSLTVGLIHRKDKIDTIFSMTVMNEPNKAHFWQGMNIAADFLEVINLTFKLGDLKRRHGLSKSNFPFEDIAKGRLIMARREELEKQMSVFEQTHHVRYRPERPHFKTEDDMIFTPA